MKTIILLKDNRSTTGWVSFKVIRRDMRGTAKVYNEGDGELHRLDYMGYGVNVGSRVSKLSIYIDIPTHAEIYNYDRGLDFHNTDYLPDNLLNSIVADLDSMPRLQ